MKSVAKTLAFVLAITVGVGFAQTVKRSFSVDFKVQHDIVRAGSPVIIKIQLKNTSDHVIYRTGVPGGDVEGELVGFPPIVRDAQGKEPPLTKWGRLAFSRVTPEDNSPGLQMSAVLRIPMPPGDVMKTEIRVNNLYDLSVPGKYTVQVRYYDDENKEELKSDLITVTVVP
jgi:hypothetical protein